jgi:hypothetical protein
MGIGMGIGIIGPPLVVVVVVGGAVVVVVGGGAIGQLVGRVILLSSRVTAPLRANTRPSTVALVCTAIEVNAMMVPTKVVLTPSVAELPTCQKTLHIEPPLMTLTVLSVPVINVDPAWKIQTALGSPWASRVTVPFTARLMAVAALYTPATRVRPVRSPTVAFGGLPAASLYAITRSDFAWAATASVTCCVPTTIPGGKPVTEDPGKSPRSPVITEGPVLVTVWPANIAKDAVVPNPTGGGAADATPLNISRNVAVTTVTTATINRPTGCVRGELDGNVTCFPPPLNGSRMNVTVCLRSSGGEWMGRSGRELYTTL